MLCGDLNGKEIQEEGILGCVRLIHFAAQQEITQHCKATILQKNCFKIMRKNKTPLYY